MSFQHVQISAVRSIRHVSLVKDWARVRRATGLPHYSDFIPNERAGDALDLMIAEVRQEDGAPFFFCRSAGARVEQIFARPLRDSYFRDSIDPQLSLSAKPQWLSCIVDRMPVYSIFSIADRNGCPVTIEQILLPYCLESSETEVVVGSIHAWSPEGRFEFGGLLTNLTTPPQVEAMVIDPSITMTLIDNGSRLEGI